MAPDLSLIDIWLFLKLKDNNSGIMIHEISFGLSISFISQNSRSF